MCAEIPLLISHLSTASLVVGLGTMVLGGMVSDQVCRYAVTNKPGDRLFPAHVAVAANLLAWMWATLIVTLCVVASTTQELSQHSADGSGWEIGRGIAGVGVASAGLVVAVVLPLVVAAISTPAVALLLRPAEWLVTRGTTRNQQASIAALLALLSGTLVSCSLVVLPYFDAASATNYLPMQLVVGPLGIVAWLLARGVVRCNEPTRRKVAAT